VILCTAVTPALAHSAGGQTRGIVGGARTTLTSALQLSSMDGRC